MKAILSLILLLSFGAVCDAEDSQIYIDVGQATVKKSLIALPPLQYLGSQATNATHLKAGQDLYRVILNDLTVSSFFSFIKPEAYLEDPNKVGLKPAPGAANGFNFANWKTIGTEFLVRGAYTVAGGDLSLEVYVYHVPTTRLVMGKSYRGTIEGFRKVAHTFADDFVKALTGKRGMFLTKLVASRFDQKFAVNVKGAGVKEIYVLDWDGANQAKISSHNSIALSPTWSTKGDKIAYTAFAFHRAQKMRNADMFTYDINTGKRFLVSYRKGINSGAAFMPGDQTILLTLSQEGNPDIFKMSVDGTDIKAITHGPSHSMNVEPAVSADGSKIAFSSDRGGRPMVYVMNSDGSGAKRLTFAGAYNSSPSWSPDGKTIAFAGQDKDHFDIFTMGADGSNLKRLTDAPKVNGRPSNNESPSWSPDGRHLVFASDRSGNSQLYLINPDGTNERRITEDHFNWEKPKWSPYLD
ncbi:MAG: translocation protein TolB [Bdellovibrionales bacterium]